MSIYKYDRPFYVIGSVVRCNNGNIVARCNTFDEALEVCSILNAHFEKKEESEPDQGGICDKCLSIHGSAFIGRKCIATKDCGGTVQDIHTPQPNREETDRVAMEFIKSGRTLEVQRFEDGQWQDHRSGMILPSFHYEIPWRIKPAKRRVVVEVFTLENSDAFIFSEAGSDGAKSFRNDKACKFVGTLEGEVE